MAYSNTISSWAFNDANAAGNWLGRQDQGPELDQARQQFATSVAQKDPESAMAWANAVTDDTKREFAVQQVYMQWKSKDADAANSALVETDVSEQKKAELLEMEAPKVTNTFGGYGAIRSSVTVEEVEGEKVLVETPLESDDPE